MAVHIMKTAHSSVSQPLTFRNLFTCCYGSPKTSNYSSMTKLKDGYESDNENSSDSDEEIHENFSKVQRSTSTNFRSQYNLAANNVHSAPNVNSVHSAHNANSVQSALNADSVHDQDNLTAESHPSGNSRHSRSGSKLQEQHSNRTRSDIAANGEPLSHVSSRLKSPLEPQLEINVVKSEVIQSDSHHSHHEDNLSESDDGMADFIDGEKYESDDDESSTISLKPISSCGVINVTFTYEYRKEKLNLIIKNADKLPLKEDGGSECFQICIVNLPQKKQRFTTKMRFGSAPQFEETFTFLKMNPAIIRDFALRFRLYGCERKRRHKLIGEAVLALSNVDLHSAQYFCLSLEPCATLQHSTKKTRDEVDGGGSVANSDISSLADIKMNVHVNQGPELLLGISYNGITGRLACEIIKGSLLKCPGFIRAPDSFVKLMLLFANGQELARSKTTVHRSNPNPLFRETFMFQVPMFQLPEVTLMVTIYAKKTMNRKQMIGWFSLGLNNTGDDENAHWKEMNEARGEQVCRWHSLLENAK